METQKIIFENPHFNVIQIEDEVTGIHLKRLTVGVLPYTISDNLLSSVGVLHEYNSFREGLYCDTIITGTVDADDNTLLKAAMRELKEESGFTCIDVDKWIFLGSFRISKFTDEYCHVFGVDVSGLEKGESTGDGSKQEEKSKFDMKAVNDALLTDEALFLAAYLRLFDFFYHK